MTRKQAKTALLCADIMGCAVKEWTAAARRAHQRLVRILEREIDEVRE